MTTVIDGDRRLVHAVFYCRCGKRWENYRTAQRLATAHAIKSGHTVNGEVGHALIIRGKRF